MATQSVSKREELVRHVRDNTPAEDRARTECEIEFLLTYRKASKADKRRLMKILCGAKAGLLPPPEVSSTWTREQLQAFADTLPEAESSDLLNA